MPVAEIGPLAVFRMLRRNRESLRWGVSQALGRWGAQLCRWLQIIHARALALCCSAEGSVGAGRQCDDRSGYMGPGGASF